MKQLVDAFCPEAVRIRVALDNLSTHKASAHYETYSPNEPRRILRKLEFHETPEHASWLNIAGAEIYVLSQPCLRRRIGDMATLQREVGAWEQTRNGLRRDVDGRFTTPDTRIKLRRLYPNLQSN
jgi:hypothetical protein